MFDQWEGVAIILHCCASRWKYSDLSLNNSAQINRFWPKRCWFSIFAHNFNQNYSQNAKFGSVRPIELVFYSSSPALNLLPKALIKLHDSRFKNTKFSSFWGGTSPLRHPLVHNTKSLPPMSKTDLHPWLKCTCNFGSWGRIWGRIL